MKILVLLLVSVAMTGCSSVVSHTESQSAVHLLGLKTLTEDVMLCTDQEKSPNNPSDIALELHATSSMKECRIESHQKVHFLSRGTPVTIFRIEERKFQNLWKYQWWALVGKTSIDGKEIEFYYMYTLTTDSPETPKDPPFPPPWN